MRPSSLFDRVRKLLEASRFDDYLELFTDDCVMQFELEIVGKAATRQYFESVMERLPDIRHEALPVTETDSAIAAAEVPATGTPSGPIPIGDVNVMPSRGPAEFIAVELLWLREGKIARWYAYNDRLKLYASLGIGVTPRAT